MSPVKQTVSICLVLDVEMNVVHYNKRPFLEMEHLNNIILYDIMYNKLCRYKATQ